jgi:hypothetical protein
MKRVFLLLAILPAMALAASPWDGTWKSDPSTYKFSGKPDVFELKNGIYHCRSCSPPLTVKADGQAHAVKGYSYFDRYTVQSVDANTVERSGSLAGKEMFSAKSVVSSDGQSLTTSFTDHSGAETVTGTSKYKRVAAGAAGAHAISGSWQAEAVSDLSSTANTVNFETTANGLKVLWNGQTLDAKFDGKSYAWSGDPGHTMTSMKRLGANSLEETDMRKGKVVNVSRYVLAADGETITAYDKDPVHGTRTDYIMNKQH